MSSSSRTSTAVTVAGVTVLASLVAYAAYFDYKRRNDVAFRKQLKKQQKKVSKSVKASATASVDSGASLSAASVSAEDIKSALEQIRAEPVPANVEDKEKFFMENVALGEQLSLRGAAFEFPAALSFFRALRVYPAPLDLIMIYQKTVPAPIFKLVMDLTNADVKTRVDGYYDVFPPSNMGVKVNQVPLSKQPPEDGKPTVLRQALVADRDYTAGEVIYQEQPIATALDLDLEGKGTHCSYCLRRLEPYMSISPPNSDTSPDPLGTTYCSKTCQTASATQSHNLLFGSSPVLLNKDEGDGTTENKTSEEDKEARAKAQKALVKYVRASGKVTPLLIARFVARMVTTEMVKLGAMEAPAGATGDLPEAENHSTRAEYTFYDHVERLRYLEVEQTPLEEAEMILIKDVLNTAMSGLDEFIQEDRYYLLKGKVLFNAIGVSFSGGRLDKPKSGERFEKWDLTRTPYGTSRQTGTAFYRVSSYLTHSCDPNTRPSFPKGTAELNLVANRAIKAGEELTMSYVRATPVEGETNEENRRRRRQELARGWRFACECEKCEREAPAKAPSAPAPAADHSVNAQTEPKVGVAGVPSSVEGALPEDTPTVAPTLTHE